jgi:hypothetical protein
MSPMLLVMAGAVVTVLLLCKRMGRLVAGAAWMIAVLGALWVVDLVAISQDWRDADGFVDCDDSCSAVQEGAGVVVVGAPILIFLLLGILVFARFGPARKDRAPWN